MYQIKFTEAFKKRVSKYIKGNRQLEKSFLKTLELLREDPKYPLLLSHKVDTKRHKYIWSSRMTGD